MRTRRHTPLLAATGVLLLGCLALLFTVNCDRLPTGGCPRFSEDESVATPLSSATASAAAGVDQPLLESPASTVLDIWCIWFPPLCRHRWMDPIPEIWYWGGPEFDISRKEIGKWARFHNACLDQWRHVKPSPESLLAAMDVAAAQCGLENLRPESRQRARELFRDLLSGKITREVLPGPEEFLDAWRVRPGHGAFADETQMEALVDRLRDGISTADAQAWQDWAQGKGKDNLREAWAAASMAATVGWWKDFGEEQGVDTWGVFADLAAMVRTADPVLVGIASLAGVIIDLAEHFWPKKEATTE